MQTIALKSSLVEAASEVLESMCFLNVLREEEKKSQTEDALIWSQLDFTGANEGRFCIGVCPETAMTMAGNFLGQSAEEITTEQMREVINELANMICGSYLSRSWKNSLFDLSHPVCKDGAIPALRNEKAILTTLTLDEGAVHLRVVLAT